MNKKVLTLFIAHRDGKVLLGMKKRGFGAGRWNGFGGKVEHGESIEDSVLREVREEAGIVPKDMRERAVFEFRYENADEMFEVHLFSASEFEGEPKETEEMRPQWFSHEEIPFADMWPDDAHWFPHFLAGEFFHGRFRFRDTDTLLEHDIRVIRDDTIASSLRSSQ
ncbi:MAG: 8-oxo-dGTP diphosphatase [Patescibacteria group bacterium]